MDAREAMSGHKDSAWHTRLGGAMVRHPADALGFTVGALGLLAAALSLLNAPVLWLLLALAPVAVIATFVAVFSR